MNYVPKWHGESNNTKINRDDGQGYDEEDNSQYCTHCGEEFLFSTSVSYDYEAYCRKGDHVMEPFGEKWPGMYQCKNCEHYQKGLDNEL